MRISTNKITKWHFNSKWATKCVKMKEIKNEQEHVWGINEH